MSYVSFSDYATSISALSKAISDLDSQVSAELSALTSRVQDTETNIQAIGQRLNDPTYGLNAINRGLSQAYTEFTNLDRRASQISDEIFMIEQKLGITREGQVYDVKAQVAQLQQQASNPLNSILPKFGLGFGIGTGALLIGAGLVAVLILRK